jgi:hypothetical protein
MSWDTRFSVVIMNMTPVPPKLKKVYFGGFLKLPGPTFVFKMGSYTYLSHTKQSKHFWVNFKGISDIGRKGWEKREKSKGKKKQFSWTLPE